MQEESLADSTRDGFSSLPLTSIRRIQTLTLVKQSSLRKNAEPQPGIIM